MSHEEEIQLTVNKIHKCLVGDKLEGQVGLIDKVDSVDDKVDALDRRFSIIENKIAKQKKDKWKMPAWIMKIFGLN